ncbi:uncharacterized protein LOC123967649 [Micropterus dolomieu]|uniref:uncharacterized protein LOC123967649 n=1 Tax=Micropterus dolomieu TaxID=147949 RepID=UPI001E8CF9B2|nr:uncharacterized protein LOC123967649 [Micropterus dolomieu]
MALRLLLLVLLIVISECRDSSAEIQVVAATQEEDVALPCFNSSLMNPGSCYRVKLIKYAADASQMKVIFARPETPKIQDAKRIKWGSGGNGQMSFLLTKLQKSDEGLYSCEVWVGWDCILVKNISLKMRECKTLQAVKAAPSTPVYLNCPVNITSGQQGPENISWVMLKGGNPATVNTERFEMIGTSLAIQSVNANDSAWYRCKYMIGQTQRCFDINLLVQVENVEPTTVPALTTGEIIWETKEEGSSGTVIAIVASVIIGTATIATLIGLFIYRRRNTPWHPPAAAIDTGGYEDVGLPCSQDCVNQRVNSLYQQVQDESMCTFHY